MVSELNEVYNLSNDKTYLDSAIVIKDTKLWFDELEKKYNKSISKFTDIPKIILEDMIANNIDSLILTNIWEISEKKYFYSNEYVQDNDYIEPPINNFTISNKFGGINDFKIFLTQAKSINFNIGIIFDFTNIAIDSNILLKNLTWFEVDEIEDIQIEPNSLFLDVNDEFEIYTQYNKNIDNKFLIHNNLTKKNYIVKNSSNKLSQPIPNTAKINIENSNMKKYIYDLLVYYSELIDIILIKSAYILDDEEFLSKINQDTSKNSLILMDENKVYENYLENDYNLKYFNEEFLNLLVLEENEKFRNLLKNILEFDPRILYQFVNYTIGIDLSTYDMDLQINDKLYGIMIIILGLPSKSIIHHERLSMSEIRRTKVNDNVKFYKENIVRRYEKDIQFMIDNQKMFLDIHNFHFYDFFDVYGEVNHNVIALSNYDNENKSLLAYNNQFSQISGWIKRTVAFSNTDNDDITKLQQMDIFDALNISNEDGYIIFKDHITKLEYIRSKDDIRSNGLYIKLNAYKYHLFVDIQEINNDLDIWEEVSFALNGEGIQNLETIYNEVLRQKRQDGNNLGNQEIITKNSLIKIKQIINEKLEENKILQEEFTLMNYSKGKLDELLKIEQALDNRNQQLKNLIYKLSKK